MKWIKASESLPEVFYGEFVVKKNGRKLITTFDQKTGFGISGNIEWLDESPAPAKTAEEHDPCNFCGKTIREQMKGCYVASCYRQYLKIPIIANPQTGQTGYSREDVKKAVDLGLSISTMSDEPFTSAKFRKTKEACIKSFLSSLTNKP